MDSNELLNQAVLKAKEIIGGDSIKIEWDYRDELSKEDKSKLLEAAFPDGIDFKGKDSSVSNEEFFKMRMNDALCSIEDELNLDNSFNDYFDEAIGEISEQILAMSEFANLNKEALMRELNDAFYIDPNLSQLIRNSDELVRINIVLADSDTTSISFDDKCLYVYFIKILYPEDNIVERYSKELIKIANIFEMNPLELAKAIDEDSNTYAYPNIEKRNNPIVEPKDFAAAIHDICCYCSNVTIGASMLLSDVIEGAQNGTLPWIVDEKNPNETITLPAGAEVILHDYMNGAGSIGEIQLKRDLELPLTQCMATYDEQYGYGIDETFGLGNDAYWEDGLIKNKKERDPATEVARALDNLAIKQGENLNV